MRGFFLPASDRIAPGTHAPRAMVAVKLRSAIVIDNPRVPAAVVPMPAPVALAEHHIVALVDCFYDKVRRDPVLGPVFNPVVDDWEEHQRMLVSFWSSVVLKSGTYRGNPMAAHRPHPIRAGHFDHWLALWRETVHEVIPVEHVGTFIDHATRIGYSLRYGLGLDHRHGARPLDVPVVSRDD